MSLILLVLFALLVYVILSPVLRVFGAVYKTRKQMNEFFNNMNGGGSAQGGKSAQSEAPRREKKIDRNVGEYVEFEEIHEAETATAADTSDAAKKSYPTDPVEDAEWEDIK